MRGDTNGRMDVFVHDRRTGQTMRASVSSSGVEGNHHSSQPILSGDGRLVAFESIADNLVPGDANGSSDIFVRDLRAGTTRRVSVGPGGVEADGSSYEPCISADGSKVAFASFARNLVPGVTNIFTDVYVHDLV